MAYTIGREDSRYSPSTDAGLGLIYRLNDLWRVADNKSRSGDLNGWNLSLDAIYRNLLYREDPILIKKQIRRVNNNLAGKIETETIIVDVKIEENNSAIHEIFRQKIRKAKELLKQEARDKWYRILMQKDIWLRKVMAKLGLYMKEYEQSPGSALFGN